MVLFGLVLLFAAIVIGVAGAASNAGDAHALSGGFDVFGYNFSGSEAALFVAGIIVGAVGFLGLALVLAGSRSSARKARVAKREVKRARRETAAAERARDRAVQKQQRVEAAQPGVANDVPLTPQTRGARAGRPWSRWFDRRGARTR